MLVTSRAPSGQAFGSHPEKTTEHVTPPAVPQTRTAALGNRLRGKTIRVPDVGVFYQGWPMGQVNTNYAKLKPIADSRIHALGVTGQTLEKFLRLDAALFVSCWWPNADYEGCIAILYWIIWLFVWDDEIDLEENLVGRDFAAAQLFRQQTLAFITHALGFGDRGKGEPESPNAIIASFRELGERLCESYGESQRRQFLKEVSFYFDMTQVEQETKFSDTLPTVAEYWKMRLGTSAMYACLALAEVSTRVELPAYLREHADMKIVWEETNIGVSLANDIWSLKKELKSEGLLSVIPLFVHAGLELQEAVDEAVEVLRRSIERCKAAEERLLLSVVPEGSQDHRLVVEYLITVNCYQTGCHYWTMRSGRYFTPGSLREGEDGALDIVL